MKKYTSVLLNSYVSSEELFNFITRTYDKNAVLNITISKEGLIESNEYIKVHYGESPYYITESGYIYFTYNGKGIQISYIYTNGKTEDNEDYFVENGIKKLIDSETTLISVEYSEDSVSIMNDITKNYGGWIDEMDNGVYSFVERV